MRISSALLSLLALVAAGLIAGCGGGSDNGAATIPEPTVTPGAPPTPTTPASTGKGGKKGQPTTTSTTPSAAAAETPCGTILFQGIGTNVPVTAMNLPCPTAKAYAKKFTSAELPSQQNLPPGWKLADCTGIGSGPETPGEPNSPRCTHRDQAFTIHLPR